MNADLLAGIFVGGRGERFGGVAKGLLRVPSGATLVERWCAIFDALGIAYVLVGEHPAYAELGIETIADAQVDGRRDLGPLGGVLSLLEHARACRTYALAVACDMPFVPDALVRRLVEAPPAALVAPRRRGRWEPFFARYEAATVLPIARALAKGRRGALQALFDAASASALVLDVAEDEWLDDWDRPEDMALRHV
ncbi:MAG: Molybdopterin-guanine dinucleotide biosynthesis protein MobA [Labilithrix sp.]|nr:Molybdopterin-guanine dinucleotide biosynthesis protein MobA [Labilithrix sp.]